MGSVYCRFGVLCCGFAVLWVPVYYVYRYMMGIGVFGYPCILGIGVLLVSVYFGFGVLWVRCIMGSVYCELACCEYRRIVGLGVL